MRQNLQRYLAAVGGAILLIAVLAGCGLHQASPAATPTPAPTSTPIASGTIKGIAARCQGIYTRHPESLPVTVRVYRWNNRKARPVATRVTSLKKKSRYSLRLQPGHYWVVAVPSPDRGVSVQLSSGATRVVNFPNVCL